MTPRVTAAVAARVLTQIRRDHRTLAMLLVLPCLLISLLWWMFEDLPPATFDRFGPALLAMFPFIVMFLVTSVTTLRERSSGTLERLLAMPMGKLDFLLGYAVAFGVVAAAQAVLAVAVSVGLLGLDVAGPVWLLGLVAVADAVLGTALGLFVSAFARTEFQAVQFMPLVVFPQILLCGLFVPQVRTARRARGRERRAAAVVRRRRDAAPHAVDVHGRRLARPRDRRRVRARRSRPRRCHPATTHRRSLRRMALLRQPLLLLVAQQPGQEARQHDAGLGGDRPQLRARRDDRGRRRRERDARSPTASGSPSTSSARTPSTSSRPRPPWRRTSTCSRSSPRAA